MGLRYIGSKARIAAAIAAKLGAPETSGRFVDAFCGTGAVAVAAAANGWRVHLNDSLRSATVMATARLVNAEQARFVAFGGYDEAVATLNAIEGVDGFITREYSPLSLESTGVERRYFTVDNARKIDGIRRAVRRWHGDGRITDLEHALLLADLMVAANHVANIAGTYGCFLRGWSTVAMRPLALAARSLPHATADIGASVADVFSLTYDAPDVAYFDPPYTKRQYAAYYHVLETIVQGDEPVVEGITGLRPWKHLASDFCYRTRALEALDQLVGECGAGRILLSYSNQGHVAREDLEEVLAGHGTLFVHVLGQVGRYRPNKSAAAHSSDVEEFLFEVRKPAAELGAAA